MRMIIISGLSGSGKTIALQTLEDLQYYCVDNLPVTLLKPFAQSLLQRQNTLGRQLPTAIGIDARNYLDELGQFPHILAELRAWGLQIEILFLQANDEVLLKRYSETRRKHPLGGQDVPLLEAIGHERRLLQPLLEHADLLLDTSRTTMHDLRERIRTQVHGVTQGCLTILFESFGFKHGIPADADFVFDVRCLPNPHWEPQLRPLTGEDQAVQDYLSAQPMVQQMLQDLKQYFTRWLPNFATGTRSYLTIAIGCTGGQHRSVYIASQLCEYFAQHHHPVLLRHRELASNQ